MKLSKVLLLLLAIILYTSIGYASNDGGKLISDSDYPWTYICRNDTMDGPACQRQHIEGPLNATNKVPLKICILTCGPYGPLWPYPTGKVSLGRTLSNFSSSNIGLGSISIPENDTEITAMVTTAFQILQENIRVKIPTGYEEGTSSGRVIISVAIQNLDNRIRLETNESYSVTISSTQGAQDSITVTVTAATFFGARHGMESLSQLIEFNTETNFFQIVNNVEIVDAPKFRYRGFMLDTARNFYPFKDLRRLIDGMSYNKLNVFHWHITDSNSFPFYSKRVPQMATYGTFGSKKIYMPNDILEFLKYANQRGVKVIPELDAPAHSGNGWQFGEREGLGNLSLCVNAEPYWDYCIQPPCGQLNPLNNHTYRILGELYKDMLEVFDQDIFHMGGDEISFTCWLSSQEIQDWMSTHNSTDLMDLWGIYQQAALTKLKEAVDNRPITPIVWSSEMTLRARQYLSPDEYVIQVWTNSTDDTVAGIYEESYRVFFSNNDTVYLDHGYGPWRGIRHTVNRRSWQVLYSQDLIGQIERVSGSEVANSMYESGRLLGGEACMFSEKVDPLNMDGKIWPRTAAYAERLWSNPPSGINATRLAYPRLIHQRDNLALRGLFPDVLAPESCYRIWGFCDRYDDTPASNDNGTAGAALSTRNNFYLIFLIYIYRFFA